MTDPSLLEIPETRVDMMTSICRQTAKVFAGKVWEHLSYSERVLVAALERGEYLQPLENGLVGAAIMESFHISREEDIDFLDHPNVGRQCG